jgi:hypothetical protein
MTGSYGRLTTSVSAVLVSIATLFTCGCSIAPPPRPANVPASAVWNGGQDGGVWIDCKADTEANLCTLFNEYSGVVIVTGRFQLRGVNRAATKPELDYHFTDFVRIYLRNGLVLERIDGAKSR